ncbi:glycosyltransferase [Pedobacter roseus]|uniref:Glycosyltransferase n=2 Tax=Pedobacter roseus TaxID=336820 RepID=A0A7G9QNQ2_9SPHI|nr:glycosyltransferase [Pedobacter roseus]
MSLPYFKRYGWEPEVVVVDESYSDMLKDALLSDSIPKEIKVHRVKAFSKKWTSKFGLGSIALRSLYFYEKKVNKLLKYNHFDLIYFSTTQFPVCILGAFWKKKFGIPYVIDVQDPWHSNYYQDKPKSERPKKYWLSYRLNKYLEPIAMRTADGLISVSEAYINTLKTRYPDLAHKPSSIITFGAHESDFDIAEQNSFLSESVYKRDNGKVNLVYIGRGGFDMRQSVSLLLKMFKRGIDQNVDGFEKVHFHFIGTSYAPNGSGTQTLMPIAKKLGLSKYVSEYTDRIGFYESINHLQNADGLIVLGSNDPAYTASKLYPYILAKQNLLAILHPKSSAVQIIEECNAGFLITLNSDIEQAFDVFNSFLENVKLNVAPSTNWKEFDKYRSDCLTKKQVDLFNSVISTN